MLISMTGFGRAECQDGDYSYKAEIRSVNNRFIEINTRLPKAYLDLEQPLKKLVKSHCARGSINITISLANTNESSGEWVITPNLPLAAQYVEALKKIQTSLGLEGNLNIDSVVGLRDIIKVIVVFQCLLVLIHPEIREISRSYQQKQAHTDHTQAN